MVAVPVIPVIPVIPVMVFAFSLGLPVPGPVWPVEPVAVVASFDPPTSRWGPGHRGIDFGARTDQPVRSATDGIIGFAGVIAGKPVVTVRLADGRRVTYEPVHALRRAGSPVAAGDTIGTVAPMGGHCGGLAGCLHVGLLRGETYLDPLALFHRPSVLKPITGIPRTP
jgi:murein DD-endopeptidase MepM/ murein hydrolase activator NlpD